MIHLVKVDGTQVKIGIKDVEKYTDEYTSLRINVSLCGDKIIIHDRCALFEDEPVNNINVSEIVDINIFGDAIVISLV